MVLDQRIADVIERGPVATPFVTLPGGRFRMGSDVRADEGPVRMVEVGPFAVSIAPVSNAEFASFLEATGHEAPRFWSDPHFTEADRPVVGINWFDALDYCTWLSEVTGRECRLPTEAEREFAAGGGVEDARAYPWGDEPWLDGLFGVGPGAMDRPIPIGSTPPNGFGLFHMAENVHEWCSDWYAPYDSEATVNPVGPPEGTRKASRGGSWRHRVKVSRIAARSSLDPGRRYNDYGFRVYASV